MIRPNLFLSAILLLWSTPLLAHPGGHGHTDVNDPKASRTWTLAAEGSHLHGTFVSAKEGKVQIRRDDGVLTTLAIDRLVASDQKWITDRLAEIKRLNTQAGVQLVAQNQANQPAGKRATKESPAPEMLEHFKPFEKSLQLRWDENHFYVGSNGMPDHPMMIGIRAWQQQVPIPQKYFGDNAWRIPLNPSPAKTPLLAKERFFRGAIALAVNGVPIFNPIKNDGRTDTLLAGELDEWGGHCGRADDYHYHIAPIHLEKTTGRGKPIAYALDGYPIYGFQDEKAPDFAPLDGLNGHKDKAGNYHYHATKTYPYLNGGFYGVVTERDGQVDPQPRAESPRPAQPPHRDAKITKFVETKPGSYHLTYDIRGREGSVSYAVAEDGSAKFTFVDVEGNTKDENYTSRRRGPGSNDRPTPPRNDQRPPRADDRPGSTPNSTTGIKPLAGKQQLTITSESVDARGFVSIDCTCDGASRSPAVAWKNAPAGTKCFAINLWHIAPDQEKSYWVVYDIPADVTQLKENSKNVGKLGLNDKRRAEYDPMCSKGPGVKKYHVTVYALSAEPKLAADKATRANLLAAIKDLTLAEGTLDFQYERKK
ncbi:MAG: YHYH protein [Planctomycetes bacterium]|nr:YHYH protein [Planctomycetota bacterium]